MNVTHLYQHFLSSFSSSAWKLLQERRRKHCSKLTLLSWAMRRMGKTTLKGCRLWGLHPGAAHDSLHCLKICRGESMQMDCQIHPLRIQEFLVNHLRAIHHYPLHGLWPRCVERKVRGLLHPVLLHLSLHQETAFVRMMAILMVLWMAIILGF